MDRHPVRRQQEYVTPRGPIDTEFTEGTSRQNFNSPGASPASACAAVDSTGLADERVEVRHLQPDVAYAPLGATPVLVELGRNRAREQELALGRFELSRLDVEARADGLELERGDRTDARDASPFVRGNDADCAEQSHESVVRRQRAQR